MKKLLQVWSIKSLREKIIFTILILLLFRIMAHIPLPGADIVQLKSYLANQGQSALGIISMLTGGALENFSIILMGLTPYINASIIMQLLAVVVPSLENLKKEGEAGQKKISQYTRMLTVPLAFVQSYGMISLVNKFVPGGNIVDTSDPSVILPIMLTVTAGTIFLMWLGELITEKGIGNGISILIFAGIVSTVPQQIAGTIQAADWPIVVALLVATVLLTIFVVYVSEGERRVPVIYTGKKSTSQKKSFLPLKINQAGMIPIIFAISIISFPSILSAFFKESASAKLVAVSEWIQTYLNPAEPTIYYNMLYALLIMGFTYFYISLVFDPKKIADNIQKRNGFIPGYRPGKETEKFLDTTTGRLSFWGGLFLAFVAIVPLLFSSFLGNGIALFVQGASIIIIVSVVLDIIRRINAQLVTQNYDKL